MKRTVVYLLFLIASLAISGCDARKFVTVSVEGMNDCSLTVVKGGIVTIENDPLVKDYKFSVVFNRSLKEKVVEIQVKCEGGISMGKAFKLGDIAGKSVVFEKSGDVKILNSEVGE